MRRPRNFSVPPSANRTSTRSACIAQHTLHGVVDVEFICLCGSFSVHSFHDVESTTRHVFYQNAEAVDDSQDTSVRLKLYETSVDVFWLTVVSDVTR